MTTYTIYYPKWIGKIIRGFNVITKVIMAIPFILFFLLITTHLEFKEKQG